MNTRAFHRGVTNLDQSCKISHISFLSICIDPPQPHVVVTTGRSQPAFAMRLKMCGVDGSILVMPRDE